MKTILNRFRYSNSVSFNRVAAFTMILSLKTAKRDCVANNQELFITSLPVTDPDGNQEVRPNPPSHPPFLNILSETKLFHFHGIFKKNEIKSAKRTPHTFIYMNPFPEILNCPLLLN